MKYIFVFIVLLFPFFIDCFGQTPKVIEIDPITDIPKESLPFDERFLLKKTYKIKPNIISIGYYEIKRKDRDNYFKNPKIATSLTKFKIEQVENGYELYITVPPLEPRRKYDIILATQLSDKSNLIELYWDFFYKFYKKGTDGELTNLLKLINNKKRENFDCFEHYDLTTNSVALKEIKDYYDKNLKIIFDNTSLKDSEKKKKMVEKLSNSDFFATGTSLSATTEILSYETRIKYRITPDFGYTYYGFKNNFGGMTPYLGFQLEFRYFNKNLPYWDIPNRSFWHGFSFSTGLTLASLKKAGKREDFFKEKSLMLGIGYRLSNLVRITAGTILFNKEDPNPLILNRTLAATPFIGLSLDLSLKQFMNDFTSLISTIRN